MEGIAIFLNGEQAWWCDFGGHVVRQRTETFRFPSGTQKDMCGRCKTLLGQVLRASHNAERTQARLELNIERGIILFPIKRVR